MKTNLLILSMCFGAIIACHAQNYDRFNLDFEVIADGFPTGWEKLGNSICVFNTDSIIKLNGKYAVTIEANSDQQVFGAVAMTIPHSYLGKTISLSGYMKTENVNGSHAGLWMRLDPDAGFDNMARQSIKGTNEWKKYTIELPLTSNKVRSIVVGGLLVGTGKIWLDNLKVKIDGVDVDSLAPYTIPELAADLDKEFATQSTLTITDLNKLTTKELANLGLIWGYLKYYHPNIQKGQYNWDAELFRILSRMCTTDNINERESLLVNWIQNLGDYQTVEYSIDNPKVKLYPDLDWISEMGFSQTLTEELLHLKSAKRENEGYYISFVNGAGNPIFTNEREMSEPYPDAGYRLLALYRYWNIIQYFYPNRHLIGTNWIDVLTEYIPKIISSKNAEAYALTMLEVIDHLNDSHADLATVYGQLDNFRGKRLAAPTISFIEKKPIVTGYYNDSLKRISPLKIGDELISVDGKTIKQIIEERWNKSPGSNNPSKFRKIATELLQSNKEELSISYKRDKKIIKDIIKTYSTNDMNKLFSFKEPIDTCFRMLNDNIAYIHIGELKSSDLPKIYEKAKKAKGLIIDFRCYPNDYNSPYLLAYHIISQPTDFVSISIGSATNPGLFVTYDGGKVGALNPEYYKGKIAVLVNEKTISASEFATMLYRAIDNVTIIGSTTAGADGDISRIVLPGGLSTNFSGIGVLYPNGDETQRVGIVPDIKVEPSIKAIKEGKDEVLEKALEHLSR